MAEAMQNTFKDNKIRADYFLKIAPDISVFDMIEKRYQENIDGFSGLNLFSHETIDSASDTTDHDSAFYRAIFRFDCSNSPSYNDFSSSNSPYYSFKAGNLIYLIAMNRFEKIKISFPAGSYEIFGVGF